MLSAGSTDDTEQALAHHFKSPSLSAGPWLGYCCRRWELIYGNRHSSPQKCTYHKRERPRDSSSYSIYILTTWLNPFPGTPRYMTKNSFQGSSRTGLPAMVWPSLAGLPNISSAFFWKMCQASLHWPWGKHMWHAPRSIDGVPCYFRWKFEGPWPDFSLVQWPTVFEMVLWGVASHLW